MLAAGLRVLAAITYGALILEALLAFIKVKLSKIRRDAMLLEINNTFNAFVENIWNKQRREMRVKCEIFDVSVFAETPFHD